MEKKQLPLLEVLVLDAVAKSDQRDLGSERRHSAMDRSPATLLGEVALESSEERRPVHVLEIVQLEVGALLVLERRRAESRQKR